MALRQAAAEPSQGAGAAVARASQTEEVAEVRIGLVCPYSFNVPGGVQAHVLDLAAQLRTMGHHTEVLGPASDSVDLPEWVTRGGIAVPVLSLIHI